MKNLKLIIFALTTLLQANLSFAMNMQQCRNQIIKLIEENGDLNSDLLPGATPLSEMAYNSKDADLLELLLKKGADPNISAKTGSYPLNNAVFNKNLKGIIILIKYGANTNIKGYLEQSSLNFIFLNYIHKYSSKDLEILKVLLQAEANPNNKDLFGTPSHEAVKEIKKDPSNVILKEMLNILLYHGADPYIKDSNNKTSIDIARENGDEKLAKHLENAGKNLRASLIKLLSIGKTPFNRDIASVIAKFRYNY